jgi:hypothetical protein
MRIVKVIAVMCFGPVLGILTGFVAALLAYSWPVNTDHNLLILLGLC